MKRRQSWKVIACAAVLCTAWNVYRVHADLRSQIVDRISLCKSSVDLVVYEIRSDDIADALIAARRRAVRVRVIVDDVHSPSATKQEQMLEDEGIAIKRISGTSRELLHDKFILFDGTAASTPSYNRSAKSLRGAGNEDNPFTTDKALISRLKEQFENVWQNAERPEDSQ